MHFEAFVGGYIKRHDRMEVGRWMIRRFGMGDTLRSL